MKFWICCIAVFFVGERVTGQVALQDEPRHKVVFENEYVRFLEGRVPARDTTLMHIHDRNSAVVFLSKSVLGIQNIGEKVTVTRVNRGDVVYRAYGEKPVNHKVWGQDESLLHFWVVELRSGGQAGGGRLPVNAQLESNDSCCILQQKGIELLWRQKLVTAYKVRIEGGKQIRLPKSNCAYLLMNISGDAIAGSDLKKIVLHGDEYLFWLPQHGMKIAADSKEGAECVLVEMR